MSNFKKSSISSDSIGDYDIKLKFVILGESMVGKTCLINRYISDKFGERYLCTIGIDFQEKTIIKNNKTIKLQIWDTAGEERYRNITKSYFQACNGFIIAYDINNKESFEQVKFWIKQIAAFSGEKTNCILIGTKSDLNERKVEEQKGKDLAKKINCKFFETSAKLNKNINEAFDALIDDVLLNYKENKNLRGSMKLSHKNTKKEKKKCC